MRPRSHIGICAVLAAIPSLAVADSPEDPTGTPAAAPVDPAATEPPTDAPEEPDAPVAPPTDAPEPPPEPPASALDPTRRQLPSMGGDQQLLAHPTSIERETPLPDRDFTWSVTADYWFAFRPRLGAAADAGAGGSTGPLVGVRAGIYRSIEVFLGALYDTRTTMTGTNMVMTGRETRIAYGVTLVSGSYAGFMVRAGMTMLGGSGDTNGAIPTLSVALSLDARWLPFRIPNMRLRTGYPLGIGLEWGRL